MQTCMRIISQVLFQFSYCLGGLFLVEVVLAILAFVFSSEVKNKVTEVLQEEGIVRYRDDPDLRNLFDWIQETVSWLEYHQKSSNRMVK